MNFINSLLYLWSLEMLHFHHVLEKLIIQIKLTVYDNYFYKGFEIFLLRVNVNEISRTQKMF